MGWGGMRSIEGYEYEVPSIKPIFSHQSLWGVNTREREREREIRKAHQPSFSYHAPMHACMHQIYIPEGHRDSFL